MMILSFMIFVGAAGGEVRVPSYPFNWRSNCTTLLFHMNEIREWGLATSNSEVEIRRVPLFDWEEMILFRAPNDQTLEHIPYPSDPEIIQLRREHGFPVAPALDDSEGHLLFSFKTQGQNSIYFANEKTTHAAFNHFWRSNGHTHFSTFLMAISGHQQALNTGKFPTRKLAVHAWSHFSNSVTPTTFRFYRRILSNIQIEFKLDGSDWRTFLEELTLKTHRLYQRDWSGLTGIDLKQAIVSLLSQKFKDGNVRQLVDYIYEKVGLDFPTVKEEEGALKSSSMLASFLGGKPSASSFEIRFDSFDLLNYGPIYRKQSASVSHEVFALSPAFFHGRIVAVEDGRIFRIVESPIISIRALNGSATKNTRPRGRAKPDWRGHVKSRSLDESPQTSFEYPFEYELTLNAVQLDEESTASLVLPVAKARIIIENDGAEPLFQIISLSGSSTEPQISQQIFQRMSGFIGLFLHP